MEVWVMGEKKVISKDRTGQVWAGFSGRWLCTPRKGGDGGGIQWECANHKSDPFLNHTEKKEETLSSLTLPYEKSSLLPRPRTPPGAIGKRVLMGEPVSLPTTSNCAVQESRVPPWELPGTGSHFRQKSSASPDFSLRFLLKVPWVGACEMGGEGGVKGTNFPL